MGDQRQEWSKSFFSLCSPASSPSLHSAGPLLLSFSFQVCSLEFDRKDIIMNKLVAATLEAKYTIFDLRTQHPTRGYASLTEKVSLVTVCAAVPIGKSV